MSSVLHHYAPAYTIGPPIIIAESGRPSHSDPFVAAPASHLIAIGTVSQGLASVLAGIATMRYVQMSPWLLYRSRATISAGSRLCSASRH